jgi:hypothetical protein
VPFILMVQPIGRMKRDTRGSICTFSSIQRKVTGRAAALSSKYTTQF